jgi:molybdate transport system regulatory protein
MEDSQRKFAIRSKIWVQNLEGRPVLGQGRIQILSEVERTGSLNAAAKALGMSYRGAWCRIRRTEERLGRALLERSTGGASGGGSRLTPYALLLVARFRDLQKSVEREADRLFADIFDVETLDTLKRDEPEGGHP